MSESPSRRIVAVIPARGGSKGIPRKNLAEVAGRPLLAHSILQAAATPAVDRVVVSTDDDEIAQVAQQWGAEVVRRPAELSTDEASSEAALAHTLDHLAEENYEPDLVVFLQATSPLRRSDDITRAIETLEREGADSLFSACPLEGFVWRREAEQLRSLSYDFEHRTRRQDSAQDLIENGSIYLFKPWVLREHGNRLGGIVSTYLMDPLDSFQVDEPPDLDRIRCLATMTAPEDASPPDLGDVQALVLDFDGVLTDDRVLVDQDGKEAVHCHRGDGLGLEMLRRTGIPVMVLSKERNPVVSARCRKLSIECIQGIDDKLTLLRGIASERGITAAQIAYVGNDLNDLPCLEWVGFPIAVADAKPEVVRVARFVTTRPGGHGAVREVCDLLVLSHEPNRTQRNEGMS